MSKNLYRSQQINAQKKEYFPCEYFEVIITYYFGIFEISLVGGWDEEEGVPCHYFESKPTGGLKEAVLATIANIESNDSLKIKELAKTALCRACLNFIIKHQKSQL